MPVLRFVENKDEKDKDKVEAAAEVIQTKTEDVEMATASDEIADD